MAKLPKCKVCKEEINKNDKNSFIKKSNYYVHTACQKNKKKEEPVAEQLELLEVIEATEKTETTNTEGDETYKTFSCHFCKGSFNKSEDVVKRGSLKVHQHCLEEYQQKGQIEVTVGRMRTCPKCKEKVNPLDVNAIDRSEATYHLECYESIQRENVKRTELYDYIALKYNIEFPTGFMLRQIREYHDTRKYSYTAILTTLKYMFEIEKVSIEQRNGLGLVPYYMEKAKRHYKKIRSAGETASNLAFVHEPVKVKAIKQTRISRANKYDLSEM